MLFVPDFYQDIPVGTYEKVQCSPAAPSPSWSGVVISAPKSITLEKGETPVLPVCGYYDVPTLSAMDGPPLSVHLQRVDADFEVSGLIVEPAANEPDEPPPASAPRHTREALKGVFTGGYFNIDALRYLKIIITPGAYELYVSYAGATSNRVRFEITLPEKSE